MIFKRIVFAVLIVFNVSFSQSVQWSKLFDIHTVAGLGGGMPTNAIVDGDNIIVPILERDILKIFKLNKNGEVIQVLNTNYTSGQFTRLVKIDSMLILIFDGSPNGISPSYSMINFNLNFEISNVTVLDMPKNVGLSRLLNLFEINRILYVTVSDYSNEKYYLFKLSSTGDLLTQYVGNYAVTEDNLDVLPNGNIVLDFKYEQLHSLKCINPVSGELLWESNYGSEVEIDLDYIKSIDGSGKIMLARLVREWDANGNQTDTIYLANIEPTTGNILNEYTLNPIDNCTSGLDDLNYDNQGENFYLTYRNCLNRSQVIFIKFSSNMELLKQIVVATPENINSSSNIFKKSRILFKDEDSVFLVYRSFKNAIELENIHVSQYSSNLELQKIIELNVTPKNGDEIIVQAAFFNNKLLIHGFVPNTDPSIFWEEMQYFTSLIDVEGSLAIDEFESLGGIRLQPNPVGNTLTIITDYSLKEIMITDQAGKMVIHIKNDSKIIDVSHLSAGIYVVKIIDRYMYSKSIKFIKS